MVCNQLGDYTEQTGMTEKYQSAYKHNHSTESALLHVRTDILQAMDNQEVTCRILLDLSAAFDMASHSTLNRLRYRFGVTDMALNWIESYLKDHTQSIVLGDMDMTGAKSEAKHLKQGVPWGSILGPTLLTLYIFTTRGYMQVPWGSFPVLCRWSTDIFIVQAKSLQIKRYLLGKTGELCQWHTKMDSYQSA